MIIYQREEYEQLENIKTSIGCNFELTREERIACYNALISLKNIMKLIDHEKENRKFTAEKIQATLYQDYLI